MHDGPGEEAAVPRSKVWRGEGARKLGKLAETKVICVALDHFDTDVEEQRRKREGGGNASEYVNVEPRLLSNWPVDMYLGLQPLGFDFCDSLSGKIGF